MTPHPAGMRLYDRPYLMLSLTSLFWAGNIVLVRYTAEHIPPIALACVRWAGACVLVLPFAWPYLRNDWPILLRRWKLIVVLAALGYAANNALSLLALQHTQAINALLIQSSGTLFVALWALVLYGIRLTWMQALGILLSTAGVLTIILRGDLATLHTISFNLGDILFASAVLCFSAYSALMQERPAVNPLSLITVMTGVGALLLIPPTLVEMSHGRIMRFDTTTVLVSGFTIVFASAIAYVFFNRGIALIGPNRAAPFFHLVPVFGSVMAITLLGEQLLPFHLVGYALVLAGIAIASRRPSSTVTEPS